MDDRGLLGPGSGWTAEDIAVGGEVEGVREAHDHRRPYT
jgi:hypothetical protein